MANFQPNYLQACPCMGGFQPQMQQQPTPSMCFNPCQGNMIPMPPPPQQNQFQCIPMPPLWNPMQGQPAPFFGPLPQCVPSPTFQAEAMGMPNMMMASPQPYMMMNAQPQQMSGPQQFGPM